MAPRFVFSYHKLSNFRPLPYRSLSHTNIMTKQSNKEKKLLEQVRTKEALHKKYGTAETLAALVAKKAEFDEAKQSRKAQVRGSEDQAVSGQPKPNDKPLLISTNIESSTGNATAASVQPTKREANLKKAIYKAAEAEKRAQNARKHANELQGEVSVS